MADSTTNIDTISSSQSQKEVTANAYFDADSPGTAFGRRASTTSALTWGYYGAKILVDGVLTTVANGTVSLTNTATNYIEATRSGTVSANTSGFTVGRIPLYEAVASGGAVTSYTDRRVVLEPFHTGSFLSKAFPSDANYTLTAEEARARVIRMTGTVTGTKNVQVPLLGEWTFINSTSAGAIQIIGATGTGITIANARAALVVGDGTNILRLTPDNVIT